jgi:hypothetical protein
MTNRQLFTKGQTACILLIVLAILEKVRSFFEVPHMINITNPTFPGTPRRFSGSRA